MTVPSPPAQAGAGGTQAAEADRAGPTHQDASRDDDARPAEADRAGPTRQDVSRVAGALPAVGGRSRYQIGALGLVALTVAALATDPGPDRPNPAERLAGGEAGLVQPAPRPVPTPVAFTESGLPSDAAADPPTAGRDRGEPAAAPQEEPERGRLIINAVGDVNVDPGYIPALATNGYEHALSGLDGLFLEDDLSIINLECPASELGAIVPKQFNFRCDVAALGPLRALGVDVANQGNNHILDYGPEAMLDSIQQLRNAGIAPVGAGATAADAHRPALFERKGWTVAVVGFGGVVPGGGWIATEDRPGMADGNTIETMVAAVEAADAVADIVVVTIHWGVELQSGPPPDDVRRAEAMIDAGADMVFGHHPHRLNALDQYRDRPISWSLGNFVWPRLSAAGSDTAVAQVIVEPSGAIISCYLDATIVSHGHPKLDDPAVRSCA